MIHVHAASKVSSRVKLLSEYPRGETEFPSSYELVNSLVAYTCDQLALFRVLTSLLFQYRKCLTARHEKIINY